MKRILITGATGFAGSHFVAKALENEYEVHVTIREGSDISYLKGLNVHYHKLSLFDKEAMMQILQANHIQYILHNAGVTKTKRVNDYFTVNTHATKLLAEAAVESGNEILKFVFISSLAAQGPGKAPGEILKTGMEDRPVSYYGKSKLLAEKHLEDLEKLPFIAFRPTGVYGPREKDFLQLIKMLKSGWELYIGRSQQTLSFIYISDLCELIFSALDSDIQRRKYLVSDGRIYERYAFGSEIAQLMAIKPVRIHVPVFAGKLLASVSEWIHTFKRQPPLLNKDKLHEILAPSWACDTSDLARDFKFAAQYDLHRGLEETISWYQREAWI